MPFVIPEKPASTVCRAFCFQLSNQVRMHIESAIVASSRANATFGTLFPATLSIHLRLS